MQPFDRWQPSDFIVHGRYCSPHQIVEELEELRQAWGSKALVLIVFRENTFFRPLLRLAHEDQERLEEMQEALSREMTFDISQSHSQLDRVSQLLASLPAGNLGVDGIKPQMLSHLEQSFPLDQDDHPRPVSRPASFHVVAFGGETPPSGSEVLARLQLMINSSAPVIAHRELEAQTDLRKLLTKTELEWQENRQRGEARRPASHHSRPAKSLDRHADDDPGYARMLLDLALEVTRSSVGNIYLVSRDGQTLKLVAQRGNDNAIDELRPSTRTEDGDPVFPGVVGRVFGRGRALIINDVDDYERANAHAQFLSVVRKPGILPYSELAVPIEQGPFASTVPPFSELPKSAPIGVLNVERVRPRDSEAGDFTPTDLSALQTIALLYALRRAGSLTAFSADSLAWLTESTALNPPRGKFFDPPDDPHNDIPLDMRSARSTLAYIAKRIFELTRSSSVTIRVVTPDQLSLARFVAEPEERLHDDHPTIPIAATNSVNAWVARTGRPCYIPNMRNHPTRPFPGLDDVIEVAQRKEIRSELCLPIKAHGRLVGTLNLESRHRSDFPDDVSAVVRALAQQVGLAISQSRRNDERRLFSFHAQQASQAHRVLREVDELEKLLKDKADLLETRFGAELTRVLYAIREASDPELTKPLEVEPLTDGWVAAKKVVETLLDKPRYKGHLDVRSLPPDEMRLPKLVGQVLDLGLDELLRNGLAVVSRNRRLPFVLIVRFEEIVRVGRPYLRAEVVNAVARPLKPDVEERLYRGPIRSGRTHIGAFVVGSFVRSVGGEVYVKENSPAYFSVRLEVPASPAGPGEDAPTERAP